VKVFDLAIARTGLLAGEASTSGFSPLTVMAEAYDHKAYYPGAEKLRFRVTGDLPQGRSWARRSPGTGKRRSRNASTCSRQRCTTA
jgi:hypothetical protein